jgi:hypothetical protein
MRRREIWNRIPDSFQHARSLKNLSGERNRGCVIARNKRKPAARVQSGNARQQVEIVVDDGFGNRRARDIDCAFVASGEEAAGTTFSLRSDVRPLPSLPLPDRHSGSAQ